MYIKNSGGNTNQTLSRFAVGMTPLENSALLVQYDHFSDVAIVLNRKSSTGILNLLTTGGGIRIFNTGYVGIGTTTPSNHRLDVSGSIRATEIFVSSSGADFVFEPGYKLADLSEVEKFVRDNKHLPGIEPASVTQENGMNISEMQTKLLQKIEELTLYIIEQNRKLEKQNDRLKIMTEKLAKIEAASK